MIRYYPHNRLASGRLRPLGHLSGRSTARHGLCSAAMRTRNRQYRPPYGSRIGRSPLSSGGQGRARRSREDPRPVETGRRSVARPGASPSRSGGRGTRTPKGLRPAVFKTAALPIRSSPPKAPKTNGPRRPRLSASHSFFTIAVPMTGTFVQSLGIGALATLATGRDFEHAPQL